MTLYIVLSLSLILCTLYYCIILLFPETYKKTSAKTTINLLIVISIVSYILGLVILYLFRNSTLLSAELDSKVALIVIPSITVSLFTANVFCPAFCIMAKQNKKETNIATQLNRLIFQYKYQSDKRVESIKELEKFQESNRKFLFELGIEIYIPELIRQSNNAVHFAPEKLINMLEDYSIQLIKEMSNYTPNPFTNSGIVFSFGISTLLTLILSYISIMS